MEYSLTDILLVALLAVGLVAVVALIRTLGRFSELAESLTATSDEARKAVGEVRESIVPTMGKVDVAVDAVNANLLRLDSIMGDIEATTEQVANASQAVNSLVNAPVDVVSTLAERFRKMWRVRKAEVTDEVARYAENLAAAAHVEYAPVGPDYAPAGAAPEQPSEPSAPVAPTSDEPA